MEAIDSCYRLLDPADGYDDEREVGEAVRRIGVERTDLHLIHRPTPSPGRYVDTWRALVAARADGEVSAISALGRGGGRLRDGDPDLIASM